MVSLIVYWIVDRQGWEDSHLEVPLVALVALYSSPTQIVCIPTILHGLVFILPLLFFHILYFTNFSASIRFGMNFPHFILYFSSSLTDPLAFLHFSTSFRSFTCNPTSLQFSSLWHIRLLAIACIYWFIMKFSNFNLNFRIVFMSR